MPRIEALGYRYRGEHGIPGRLYFEKTVDCRTVAHAHMFPSGHPAITTHLLFRDHLRTHLEAARDYEQLKRELAAKYQDDREAYTAAKANFIDGIIAAAMGSAANWMYNLVQWALRMESSERVTEIVLPSSIEARHIGRLAFRPSYSRYDTVRIDLSDLRSISPIGVITLICLIRKLSEVGIRFDVVVPNHDDTWTYLYQIGFLEVLEQFVPLEVSEAVLQRVDQSVRALIPVRSFTSYQEVEEIAAQVEEVFQESPDGLAPLLPTCHTVVAELAGNVVAHSGTGVGWVFAQRYATGESRVIEIAVGDSGIGVRRSLAKNAKHKSAGLDDRGALSRALGDGVSGVDDPYRGYGLGQIRAEIGSGLERGLFMASGRGRLRIYRSGRFRTWSGAEVPGVVAEARVPC